MRARQVVVAQKVLLFVRVGLVLLASGLLVYLLLEGNLSPQLRVILVAALVFYVVRLWLTASRMRRERMRARSAALEGTHSASPGSEPRLGEDEEGGRS